MKNFKLPFFHGKSTIVDWIPNDTKEEFEKHLRMYPDSEHLNHYKDNPIEYKLNNYGFRTDDDFFDGDTGTVYLGCSHTFGTGLHLKDVWSYKLHQKVGEGKFFNLSCGGTGATSHYYFLKYFSDKLNIKKVYHYYPHHIRYRYGFMNGDGKIDIHADWNDKVEMEMWKEYLMHDSYNKLHNDVYKDAITNVCNEIGCDYHRVEDCYIPNKLKKGKSKYCNPYHKTFTPARDLMHYYSESHDKICKSFEQLVRNKSII